MCSNVSFKVEDMKSSVSLSLQNGRNNSNKTQNVNEDTLHCSTEGNGAK